MDKNAIKKFAVWARRELISRVSQKALQYGITEDSIVPAMATSVNGIVLSNDEIKQRRALIEKINDKGYQHVMEEVAYTWFNRFIALRFMEVNGYLPSHVRVFTDDENNFKPQILTEAINLELDGLNLDKVYELKDANDNEGLFKYLIIVQCNAFNPIMPKMFQKISDYTELLFPDNLLREGSVIQQMIELIPEEDWKDAVQIIGWLYQYYNSEKKDEVFAALKKNVKITKENIPAATQLFTPDWIVRYMVENSLGRLWLEGHPNDEIKKSWKYYLSGAEQQADVLSKLANVHKEYAAITPEQIRCIDPCCGSGHILAYMFDILIQIYETFGYSVREAVGSIVKNNIYGLDIDERAAQLAYFSMMMKARQYDRRFFARKNEEGNIDVPQPHVYSMIESTNIDKYAIDYFVNGDKKIQTSISSICCEMKDAKEFGSMLNISPVEWNRLYARFEEIREDININRDYVINNILPIVEVAHVLAEKYHVVVTNPPYMGGNNMSVKLADYVKKNYPNSKSDLFACFIEKGNMMAIKNGYNCMVTMQSWMFLSSFETMRKNILAERNITNLMHMENMVMGIAFGTAVTVIQNVHIDGYKGTYNHIKYSDIENGCPREFPVKENRFAQVSTNNFKNIAGSPIAYWLSDAYLKAFNANPVGYYAEPRQGFATGDNGRFLRLWHEISVDKFSSLSSKKNVKWYPCNKGGSYRKWFGNNDYVVNYENDGFELKAFSGSVIRNPGYYFKKGLTWSTLSNAAISFRYSPEGFLFESKGSVCFMRDNKYLNYLFGLLNSKVCMELLAVLSPTIDYHEGPVSRIPCIYQENKEIEELVEQNIKLAKKDWDSDETSWDFKCHPLIDIISKGGMLFERGNIHISECYQCWESECLKNFNQLRTNEEELNRLFINIYGLQNELTPEIEEKDVTIRLANKKRDIQSLISYAVGCMFGRYSLDANGLVYAGGEWDETKYINFMADKDNIIPICDDEYFEDDVVNRFVHFIEVVYGNKSLEENLQFIAEVLGGSGQPREVIRKYFMTDFYTDHLKKYQKRPIYWLFDSGKKNGFKALVYMHRYSADTIARMRTDYVHEQQSRYRTAIADLEQRIVFATTSERVKLNKKFKTLKEQAAEIQVYEEKIHHLADQYISIDLDNGVKKNYEIFKDVLAKIK